MEQKSLNRHDLLFLTPKGKEMLLETAADWDLDLEVLRKLLTEDMPVIVKRQTKPIRDTVEVGISLPVIENGVRLRRSWVVPLAQIRKIVTPYEVAENYLKRLPIKQADVFKKLKNFAGDTVKVGLFGSTALGCVTGLDYIHPKSDFDFIIKGSFTLGSWLAFLTSYIQLKENINSPLDGEIYLEKKGSIKISELASPPQSVLVKGLYEAFLLPTQEALNILYTLN